MKPYKLLSIDETGKASYDHSSKLFVLSGAVIPEKLKPKIDHKMRVLKKKFFNDEELVFHARDMSRRKGPFSALNTEAKERQFWSEFISLVNNRDTAEKSSSNLTQNKIHISFMHTTVCNRRVPVTVALTEVNIRK